MGSYLDKGHGESLLKGPNWKITRLCEIMKIGRDCPIMTRRTVPLNLDYSSQPLSKG